MQIKTKESFRKIKILIFFQTDFFDFIIYIFRYDPAYPYELFHFLNLIIKFNLLVIKIAML